MGDVRFIHKDGRVIPIRAAKGAARVAGVGIARGVKKIRANPKQPIKVHGGLRALSTGLSIASGALGVATFNMGTKGFLGGLAAGHALDAVGVAANAASVRGKGRTKERAIAFARHEATNLVIGNAVYGAGLLMFKKNREKLVDYAAKILEFGRKALAGM